MSRLHETSLSHVLFNVSEIAGESSSCSYKHRWGCFEQSAPLSASCLPLDDTGQVNGVVCALERRLYLQCCDGLFPACCVSTSGGDGSVTCNGPITLSDIDESGCVFLAIVEIELVVCVLWKACLRPVGMVVVYAIIAYRIRLEHMVSWLTLKGRFWSRSH